MYPEEEIVIVYPEENQTIAIENHGDIVILLHPEENTIVIIVKSK